MSATFTSLWVYILAPLVGDIAAAVLYDQVIGRADAPTPDDASDTAQEHPRCPGGDPLPGGDPVLRPPMRTPTASS